MESRLTQVVAIKAILKMNIKGHYKIGAHEYKVELREMDGDNNAIVNSDNHTIYIDSKAPESLQEEMLFHEVLHAIFHNNGTTFSDKDEEEQLVQPIAHAFYLFLIDNKII